MEEGMHPGLTPGIYLYNPSHRKWAVIVYDKTRREGRRVGVQWINGHSKGRCYWGIYDSALSMNRFRDVWRIAGSSTAPKVPEDLKYEPPNNQGRTHCFWHPETKTKEQMIKELGVSFTYCPNCKR